MRGGRNQGGPGGYGPEMMGWGPMHLITLLLGLALIGGIIWLALKLKKANAALAATTAPTASAVHPGSAAGAPDALRQLDERLARGDIDVTDYAARRRALLGETVRPDAPAAEQTKIDPLA